VISVAEARARIVAAMTLQPVQAIAVEAAAGRVLAEDAIAAQDQPPFPISAMDGYAVRGGDRGPARVIGEAAAGHPFTGRVGEGQAVRIFTGGVVPNGADAILIQENVQRTGDSIAFDEAPAPGRFVRPRGLDFTAGEVLLSAGRRLSRRVGGDSRLGRGVHRDAQPGRLRRAGGVSLEADRLRMVEGADPDGDAPLRRRPAGRGRPL